MARRAYRKKRVTRGQRIAYLSVFFVFAILIMLRPSWDSIFHALPGDFSTPLDALNKLEWRKYAFNSNKDALNAPVFWPYLHTLGYSNLNSVFLAPYAFVSWFTANHIAALNITYLLMYLVTIVASYCTMFYFTGRSSASVVGATAFTFSGFLMEGWNDISFTSAALIPILVILLFKLFDKPEWWKAALIGVLGATLLWSNYAFGVSWYVAAALIIILWILKSKFKPGWKFMGTAIFAVALTAIFSLSLLDVQKDIERDTVYTPVQASAGLKPIDLITPPHDSLAYQSLDTISSPPANTNHRLFNGFVATFLVFLGLLTCIRQWRARRSKTSLPSWTTNGPTANGWYIFFLILVSLVLILLAAGPIAFGETLPFANLAKNSILFRLVTQPVQLMVVPIFVAALLIALGFRALVSHARYDVTAGFLALICCLLIMSETSASRKWTTFGSNPTSTAVYRVLAKKPAGVVAELPIANVQSPTWKDTEVWRSYFAIPDRNPRINGYASRIPKTYKADSNLIARFPEQCSVDRLQELGVRYVILHTNNPVGSEEFDHFTIPEIVNALPPETRSEQIGTAWLLDFGPVPKQRPDASVSHVVCD